MTPDNTKPGFIFKTQNQALSLNICKKVCYALAICLIAVLVAGFFFPGFQAVAGTETGKLQKQVIEIINEQRRTQVKEDTWEKEKAKLVSSRHILLSEKEGLEKNRDSLDKQLKIQHLIIAEAKRKIEEAELIRANLHSYLESIIEQLEEGIKRDLPFLLEERNARILSIKELLSRPDKTDAEKYRRVMEALQIETVYGRTVEVYSDSIDFNEQSVLVDILRLGRLSLFCRTPDKKKVAHYDQIAKKWVLLPANKWHEVGKAIEMAGHERTSDLAKLPIGRIVVQ